MKIIAFIGVIGSGKNYQVEKLREKTKNAQILGFSDGVREFTWKFLGWKPKNEEEYEYFKENPVLNLSSKDWIAIQSMTGRMLMENIANKMRELDHEFWGKYWLNEAKSIKCDTLIVPDCRHFEEAEKIINGLSYQHEFIFCNYESDRYEIRNHSSEKFAQTLLGMGCEHLQNVTRIVEDLIYSESET